MRSTLLTFALVMLLAISQQVQAQDCNAAAAQASQLKSQIENLNGRVARHQQAIKNLNLDMRAEEVNEWAKLSEEARDEARDHLWEAVLTSTPPLLEKRKLTPALSGSLVRLHLITLEQQQNDGQAHCEK
ncbi:MAG: hypothetical protein JST84_25960 [Acidobacteria bacterium]|nr:hypothetical protein [Acidobacteriota bacterium]